MEAASTEEAVGEPLEDPEYPGVRWVKPFYVVNNLKDREPMPRCQDLPPRAFGSLRNATRVFAVTHPWLGRWHPDPEGIQMETMRAKFLKWKKQLRLDPDDLLFFDYMSLPQVSASGVDDRTAEEKQRLRDALSGDLMGRIYLTARVIIIDEVPKTAQSKTPYLDRGWCYFECVVASMNTFPRDVEWVDPSVKDAIAQFREMSAVFRENGDLGPMLHAFDTGLTGKAFANPDDFGLVRGFFLKLAGSQRLIAAAARGSAQGVVDALESGADPQSRNGQGRTALHVAAMNDRVNVVACILRRTGPDVVAMRTMENETALQLAKEAGSRESQVLIRYKLGDSFPLLVVRTIENDDEEVCRLLEGRPLATVAAPVAEEIIAQSRLVTPPALPAEAQAATVAQNRTPALSPASPPLSSGLPAGRRGRAAAAAVGSAARGSVVAAVAPKAKARGINTAAAPASAPPTGKVKAKSMPARGSVLRSSAQLILDAGPSQKSPPASSPASPVRSPTPPVEPELAQERAATPKLASAKQAPPPPPPIQKASPNEQDDQGYTALHYAVYQASLPIIEALLAARADVDISNEEGESPLALARRMKNTEVLGLLENVQSAG